MEEWKNDLFARYDLEEIVPDNVFFHDFNVINFPDKSFHMLVEIGKYYQILSISVVEFGQHFYAINRMIIVVGKKQ